MPGAIPPGRIRPGERACAPVPPAQARSRVQGRQDQVCFFPPTVILLLLSIAIYGVGTKGCVGPIYFLLLLFFLFRGGGAILSVMVLA
jgi:hypothetical protein